MAKSEQLTLETRWKYPSRAPLSRFLREFIHHDYCFLTLSHSSFIRPVAPTLTLSLSLSLVAHHPLPWAFVHSRSVTSIFSVDTLHCIRHRTISNTSRQMSVNVASFANTLRPLSRATESARDISRNRYFI